MPPMTPPCRRVFTALAASLLVTTPSWAALKPGAAAPDFATQAALGGKVFDFKLAEALKQGPVVLYFFPKSFTSGCTIEAHQFAEANPKFKALGATLIGMSADDIQTQQRFSVEACRNEFAVAADPGARTAKQYDATLAVWPGMADRITYVIGMDGKVAYSYASLSPDGHVENALKAVAALKPATASPRGATGSTVSTGQTGR